MDKKTISVLLLVTVLAMSFIDVILSVTIIPKFMAYYLNYNIEPSALIGTISSISQRWYFIFPPICLFQVLIYRSIRSQWPYFAMSLLLLIFLGAFSSIAPRAFFQPMWNVASAADARATLGNPFVLAVGQTAQIDDMSLTLVKVADDSRCPEMVECFWPGEIVAEITLKKGGNSESVQLTPFGPSVRNRNRSETNQKFSKEGAYLFEGFTVRLVDAKPATQESRVIKQSDYRLTFIVTRLSAQTDDRWIKIKR